MPDAHTDAATTPDDDKLREIRARWDAAVEDHPTSEAEMSFFDNCLSDMGDLFDEIDRLKRERDAAVQAERERAADRDVHTEYAAATPDGDDALRDQLTDVVTDALDEVVHYSDPVIERAVDVLLPRIRDHVAAAVQAERERLAQDLEARALRVQVAKAIRGRLFRGDAITSVTVGRDTSYPESLADSLMPPIRDHIAAVQAERERVDGSTSDGYHTFDELYDFRMLYNAHAANGWQAVGIPVVKSWRHSDGELCFGGGWFVVVATLPTGQVSNHYEVNYWDLFRVPEVELPPEWDGHTSDDVVARLRAELYRTEPTDDR